MNKRKISVVIILYFSKHLIPDIVLNIKQTVKELGEIILVNNSDDNIDEFQSQNVIVIYSEKNGGYGAGINLGVKMSKYEYLLIINPDIHLKTFDISIAEINNQVIISGHNPAMPGYYLKFPSLFSSFVQYLILVVVYIKILDKLTHFKRIKKDQNQVLVDYVSGALIFTNKKTFNKIGGFDDSFFLFYEETDLCKRASKLRIPVIATSKILYYPKAGKSSSKNVNIIKIKSGIISCKRYHLKYNNPYLTKAMFALLKLYYVMLIILIYPFSLLNRKLNDKKRQLFSHVKYY